MSKKEKLNKRKLYGLSKRHKMEDMCGKQIAKLTKLIL